MHEGGSILRAALGSALLMLPLACGGGDGGGPMDPGNGDGCSVSGTYVVSSEILENTCGGDVPTQGTVEIIQEGNQIVFSFGELGALPPGTFNTVTGEFLIDVSVTDPILGSLEILEEGQFSSNTQYTSEVMISFDVPGEDPCTIRTRDMGTRQ